MTDEGLLTNKKYVWTDKAGKKLTMGEFMQRWKQGMQSVTPLQQAKVQLYNYWIILAGILLGIVISAMNDTWWLMILLIGSFGLSSLQALGIWQRYNLLKSIEKEVQDASKESEEHSQ